MHRLVKQNLTRTRTTIIAILKNYTQPVSLAELLRLTRITQPKTAFSTVYRIMKRLEDRQQVVRMDWRERGSRYEWHERSHHHHVHCTVCGNTVDIDDSVIQVHENRLAEVTGYAIGQHHLVFEGICPSCQTKTASV